MWIACRARWLCLGRTWPQKTMNVYLWFFLIERMALFSLSSPMLLTLVKDLNRSTSGTPTLNDTVSRLDAGDVG